MHVYVCTHACATQGARRTVCVTPGERGVGDKENVIPQLVKGRGNATPCLSRASLGSCGEEKALCSSLCQLYLLMKQEGDLQLEL